MKRILSLVGIIAMMSQLMAQQPAFIHMDVNDVDMLLTVYGGCNYRIDSTESVSGYEFPKGSGRNTLSACGLWFSGHDIAGQAVTAFASDFKLGSDFSPGPVTNQYGSTNDEVRAAFNRVWTIRRWELDLFLSQFDENGNYTPEAGYRIPPDILEWPAHGPSSEGLSGNFDWYLAPFVDTDGDGHYNPYHGDYPKIKGDQCAFFVFNANSPTKFSAGYLRCEIQGMAYAFDELDNPLLNNTIFFNYKIFHRTTYTLMDYYVGYWCDFDIGCKYDDYVGCDVENSCFYAYNAYSYDGYGEPGHYGEKPPCQVVTILKGVRMDDDGIDNLAGGIDASVNGTGFGDGIVDNECYGLTNFMYYTPNDIQDPNWNNYYWFQRSGWGYLNPLQYGGNGHVEDPMALQLDCRFAFPGDTDPRHWGTDGTEPSGMYAVAGWSEEECHTVPDDRLCVGSMGPLELAPGDVLELDLALTSFQDDEIIWHLDEPIGQLKHYFEEGYTDSGKPFVYYYDVAENPINQNIVFYPNPVESYITIETDGIQIINIYNALGQLVKSVSKNGSSEVRLDVSEWASGMYLVEGVDGRGLKRNGRFVK